MTGAPRPGAVVLDAKNNFGGPKLLAPALIIVIAVVAAFAGAFVFAVILVLVALAVLQLVGRDAMMAVLRWNAPQLELPQTMLQLGSQPVVTYRRRPRRVTDIGNCTIACRVYCEEEVRYQRGSSTHTDTTTVFEDRSSGQGFGASDGLVGDVVLDISAHAGAPTLSLTSNKVRWFVEVTVSGTSLPKDNHRFEFTVGSTLDERYRSGVQDS